MPVFALCQERGRDGEWVKAPVKLLLLAESESLITHQ